MSSLSKLGLLVRKHRFPDTRKRSLLGKHQDKIDR